MNILVTGINGFIGSHLARRLVKDGYNVSGLVRQSSNRSSVLDDLETQNIKLYQGNLLDYYGLVNIIRDARPDVVCHLGAITSVSYSFDHPLEVNEVNYIGTMKLVEALKSVGPIRRFIFSSSMEVYGYQPKKEPFTEDLEPHPLAPYAVAKYAAEKYLEQQSRVYDFPAMAFRQTNCYGRQHNDYFVVEAIITKILKAQRGVIDLGRKEPVRNFIHVNDLVDLWIKAIEKQDASWGVYNTGPDNGGTIENLYYFIAEKMGWQGRPNWNAKELRPGEVYYLNSTGKKAQEYFDWMPQLDLDTGLDATIAYWKEKYGRS